MFKQHDINIFQVLENPLWRQFYEMENERLSGFIWAKLINIHFDFISIFVRIF
jgi:hypothetical protein